VSEVLAASIIALMMEAAGNSETSVNFYQTTRLNNPEDSRLQAYRLFTYCRSYESQLYPCLYPVMDVFLYNGLFLSASTDIYEYLFELWSLYEGACPCDAEHTRSTYPIYEYPSCCLCLFKTFLFICNSSLIPSTNRCISLNFVLQYAYNFI
jgi:hypothetical protein